MEEYQHVKSFKNESSTVDKWGNITTFEGRIAEVKYQLAESDKRTKSMDFYRRWAPRIYSTLYGPKTNINPKGKVEWIRPSDWPDNVPFGDPNNGSEVKDKKEPKSKKGQVEPMFQRNRHSKKKNDEKEENDPKENKKEKKFIKKQLEPMFEHLVELFEKKYGKRIVTNDQISMASVMGGVALPNTNLRAADNEQMNQGNFHNVAKPTEACPVSTQGDDILWNVELRLDKKLESLKPRLKAENWNVLNKYLQFITTICDYDKMGAKTAAFEMETSIDNFHANMSSGIAEEMLLNIDEWKSRLFNVFCGTNMANTEKTSMKIKEEPEDFDDSENGKLYQDISMFAEQTDEVNVEVPETGQDYGMDMDALPSDLFKNESSTVDKWGNITTFEGRIAEVNYQLAESDKRTKSMDFYRRWAPRIYSTLYGPKTNINPKGKVEWIRPSDWPDNVPFGDPNNGSEVKDKKEPKSKKGQVEPMFQRNRHSKKKNDEKEENDPKENKKEKKFIKKQLEPMFEHLVELFEKKYGKRIVTNDQISMASVMDGVALPNTNLRAADNEQMNQGNFHNVAKPTEACPVSTQGDDILWNVELRLDKKLESLKPRLKAENWNVLNKYLQFIHTICDYDKMGAKTAAFEMETSIDNFHANMSSGIAEEMLLNIDEWKSRLFNVFCGTNMANTEKTSMKIKEELEDFDDSENGKLYPDKCMITEPGMRLDSMIAEVLSRMEDQDIDPRFKEAEDLNASEDVCLEEFFRDLGFPETSMMDYDDD
ncbi:DgyrCDS7426 [Dimorphilus gyrociliatus]|uniref:DgyrCDS7426 n=1 Tax=Dimorphilus gyrociliatus TaxID=2664684 RepID=A0A7I8VR69_9ANNE|nr:DgyrCDS7426 [Dimorphilus gyrociliatus]